MDVNAETRPGVVVSATATQTFWAAISGAFARRSRHPPRHHVAVAALFFCVLKRRYASVLVSTQASLENDWRAFNKAI